MKNANTHCISLLLTRNESAFKEVYYAYSRQLYSVAFQILKEDTLAQEVVQETFIALWENLNKLKPDSNVWGYLYVVARRNCLNKLRALGTSMKFVNEARQLLEVSTSSVSNKIEKNELQAIINSYIAELPPKQREVFQMSREDGKSHLEIAQELNLSPNTVRNHIVEVLRKLKGKLKTYGYYLTIIFSFLTSS